jgi:hypothetical protein
MASKQSQKRAEPMMRAVDAIKRVLLPPSLAAQVDRGDDGGAVLAAVTPVWNQLEHINTGLNEVRRQANVTQDSIVQIDRRVINVESRLTDAQKERGDQGRLLGNIDKRLQQVEPHSPKRRSKASA